MKGRYLDKLVDELAKGRPMDKILREYSTPGRSSSRRERWIWSRGTILTCSEAT